MGNMMLRLFIGGLLSVSYDCRRSYGPEVANWRTVAGEVLKIILTLGLNQSHEAESSEAERWGPLSSLLTNPIGNDGNGQLWSCVAAQLRARRVTAAACL